MSGQPVPSTQIKPPEQRPEHPEFWNTRFGAGTTPWDAGCVPTAFANFITQQSQPYNTLIPGCGSAWEAAFLAENSWPVTALDFSPVAVNKAREILADAPVTLICDDFFTFTPSAPFQIIYERAFLCALPRKLWANWGQRVADLLPSGGLLAGFFFVCEQPKGPPFGIEQAQLDVLLTPHFVLVENATVDDSIPVFSGKERWQVWRRI